MKQRRPALSRLRQLAALSLLFVVLAAPAAAQPKPAWRSVGRGIEHLSLAAFDADLVRFDLAHHRVDVLVPGARAPLTAVHARAQEGAIAAVNGGFFDTDGRPLGLRIAGGKTLLGLRPRVDWGVLEIRRDHARIVHSRAYAASPEILAAVQVGPRILVEKKVPTLKPQTARRTAVAVDADGRHLTIIVTRTRILAADLGRALAGLGFSDALMLDGGPSTQISLVAGGFNLDVPGGYPVPDLLVVLAKP
jgi:uncharacterized protein YigE (DUF2233 family)